MREPKRYFVYIMTNRPRSHVLYTGITGDLRRRVFQHKNKVAPDSRAATTSPGSSISRCSSIPMQRFAARRK